MRPPALDELGLVPALRQQAVGLRNRDGEPVAVDVTAPDELPDLPAAVEVAAYRIVMEALTNVARHSTSASALGPARTRRRRPARRGHRPRLVRCLAPGRRVVLDAGAGGRARRDPRGRAGPVGRPGGGAAAALTSLNARTPRRVPLRRTGPSRGGDLMSNSTAVIIVIIAIVVVVAVVVALLVRSKGRERRARQANELRTQAAGQSTDVEQTQRAGRGAAGRGRPGRRGGTARPGAGRGGPPRAPADRGPARGHPPRGRPARPERRPLERRLPARRRDPTPQPGLTTSCPQSSGALG